MQVTGQKQFNQFVEGRLLSSAEKEVKFRDSIHKKKPMFFLLLFEPIRKAQK